MLDKVLTGSKAYWSWLTFLLVLVGIGSGCFLIQYKEGLGMTGLSRDVSWGLYIAQLTFLVGVAASAVMLVLPYYLHNIKEFGRITILGEFLAVAAIAMCGLFVFLVALWDKDSHEKSLEGRGHEFRHSGPVGFE